MKINKSQKLSSEKINADKTNIIQLLKYVLIIKKNMTLKSDLFLNFFIFL